MQTEETMVVNVTGICDDINQLLKQHNESGWNLFQVVVSNHSVYNTNFYLFFKRPIFPNNVIHIKEID